MLEEWKNKQVKIFLTINGEPITRTGQILETDKKLFRFKDKFGETETFAISTIQQIKEVEK